MTNDEIRAIALEVAKEMGFRCVEDYILFATRFLAAINAKAEPVAWGLQMPNEKQPRQIWTVKDTAFQNAMARWPEAYEGAYQVALYTTPQPAIPAWQPIETPPKEWGSYLIWHPKYGMETLWFQLKDGGNDGRKAGNWYSEEGDDDYPCNARVTHWMPLPAAPKPEEMK